MGVLTLYKNVFGLKLDRIENNIIDICNLLNIDYSIVKLNIYFGEDAVSQILQNTNLTKAQAKKKRGMFLYLNKDGQVLENPLVCIVNVNKGTLAHELCHYKQFIKKDKDLLDVNYILQNECYYTYLKNYPYYSCEREAFNFALSYLSQNKEVFSNIRYLVYYLNYNFLKLDYYINKILKV